MWIMEIEKEQYFSKHQDIRYYNSMIRKQDPLVNNCIYNLKEIRFAEAEDVSKLLIQSLNIEVRRQLKLIKYSMRNLKAKAHQLWKRFPHKINKPSFTFLDEIKVEPYFDQDQSMMIYEDDKATYVDTIPLPADLMFKFFKGSSNTLQSKQHLPFESSPPSFEFQAEPLAKSSQGKFTPSFRPYEPNEELKDTASLKQHLL